MDGWPEPLVNARIAIPETKQSADSEGLILRANDPLATLERRHWRHPATHVSEPPYAILGGERILPPFTLNYGPSWAAIDESQILWELINDSAGHGIAQGTLANGVDRTLAYPPGKEIAEAIGEITDSEGGVDFELRPVEETDGTLVEFDTFYPRQGSDLSASVVFEFAKGARTAKAFEHAPQRPVNQALVIGGNIGGIGNDLLIASGVPSFPSGQVASVSLGYRAWHQDSIDQYGVHEDIAVFSDAIDYAFLQSKAIGMVAAAAYPVAFFDFTPDPDSQVEGSGVRFAPDGDFWMGDTIACDARLPRHDEDESLLVEGRVNEAVFTEQENGELELDFTCAPEVGSGDIDSEYAWLVGVS